MPDLSSRKASHPHRRIAFGQRPVESHKFGICGLREMRNIGFSDVALDGQGNAYVVGSTNSPAIPLVNPLQKDLGGGRSPIVSPDAFVAKLNLASGSVDLQLPPK